MAADFEDGADFEDADRSFVASLDRWSSCSTSPTPTSRWSRPDPRGSTWLLEGAGGQFRSGRHLRPLPLADIRTVTRR
jgi:hypothetical protein